MILELPKELTIAQVHELKGALLEALGQHESVELDAGAVAEVDAAGLQVLCAAHRSAVALGRSLAFGGTGRGPVIDAALATAGLLRRHRCEAGCPFEEAPRG